MVEALEHLPGAGAVMSDSKGTDDLANANRAARALERRRLGCGISAAMSVREALLQNGPAPPPPSTMALGALHLPLVLTTNYDDLYVAAVHQRKLRSRLGSRSSTSPLELRSAPVQVVGRTSVDCHRVLCALNAPAPRTLWALQGYLGGQATVEVPDSQERVLYDGWAVPYGAFATSLQGTGPGLHSQIVVGHADYRRVALRSEGFRRTFAEVFRQRSLLFVGSGLTDRYLLDLFGQIVELYGPGTHPHFAIARRGRLDRSFLHRNYGIWVLEIASYDELPDVIAGLRAATLGRRHTYRSAAAELVIDTAPLPAIREESGCVVLSAGGSNEHYPRVGRWVVRHLADAGHIARHSHDPRKLFKKEAGRNFVWRLDPPSPHGTLVLLARARLDPLDPEGLDINPVSPATQRGREQQRQDKRGRLWRDFRVTTAALLEVLNVARVEGRRHVVSALLASGGLRTVPRPVMLMAMMHAWSTTSVTDRPSLTIHTIDEEIRVELESGRLDAARLLSLPDSGRLGRPMQFWLEIVRADSEVERILVMEDPLRPVRDLLADYGVAGHRWVVVVEPVPCLGWAGWRIKDIDDWTGTTGKALSLERIGVLHRSTLRLQECPPGEIDQVTGAFRFG